MSERIKKTFLNEIHIMRGFSIILVVLSHTIYMISSDSASKTLLHNFLANASVFFTFISGFLLYHLHRDQLLEGGYYRKFLGKKALYVLLPYLFISIIIFTTKFSIGYLNTEIRYCLANGGFARWLADKGLPALLNRQPFEWLFALMNGFHAGVLWYIPMILLLSISAPLFIYILKKSPPLMIGLVIVLTIGASLIHRPDPWNSDTIHNSLYFLPVYLLGFIYSRYREWFEQKWLVALCALIGVALLIYQTAFMETSGNFHKASIFQLTTVDINLYQKLFLIPPILAIFKKLSRYLMPVFDLPAKASFPIFFLQEFSLLALMGGIMQMKIDVNFALWALLSLLVIALSIVVYLLVKLIFRKYSRVLIGA